MNIVLDPLSVCTVDKMRVEVEAFASEEQCSSSTSSSIGNDSDVSLESEDEAHSHSADSDINNINGPLDMMESLQQVLPIRRGISKFYDGKSKSFTSLEDATSSPSVKDIAKPENAYTRRRRNLMAFNHVWDNKLKSNGGGISKKTTLMSSSRSSLALAFAINYDSCSSCTSDDSTSSSTNLMSPPPPLPPLHPRNGGFSVGRPSWRSFSVVDLHHCASAATIKITASSLRNEAAHPS